MDHCLLERGYPLLSIVPDSSSNQTMVHGDCPDLELKLNFGCQSYGNNYKSILSSERNITSIECKRGGICSACIQRDISK
ncbi:MAG: hypothetical protein EZS28_054315 [Streblomastix strix]|uniref:Uncharacterized protein n=1 Tax=Streblomastix strix TaxID=222440 RepID=A0A5J4QRD4_9EUKA|nr:MAG: hypothetical protein EZS28_054315 [Streblomastix strix]